ncbi:MAG: RsmE family RNA methyltransferase [Candidatus Omnitrophota bacterium]
MSKIRIYIEPERIGDLIEIGDRDIVHKLKNVLRLKEKESVYIFDGKGKEYIYTIKNIEKKRIIIEKSLASRLKLIPKKKIILAFPLTKESKIDFILQKATELGVSGFIPYVCERSLKAKPLVSKIQRWKRIVMEAVRQSEALWPPFVENIYDFQKLAESSYELKLAASIEGERIEDVLNSASKEILIIIGPEGDFSPSEFKDLEKNNFKFINLSSNLLKVETAAIFSAGLVKYFLGDES